MSLDFMYLDLMCLDQRSDAFSSQVFQLICLDVMCLD